MFVILALAATGASLFLDLGTKKVAYVGNNTSNGIDASFELFTGTEFKNIRVWSGERIILNYDSEITDGDLIIYVDDTEGNLVHALDMNETGTIEIIAYYDGLYEVSITGKEAKGSFHVSWEKQ